MQIVKVTLGIAATGLFVASLACLLARKWWLFDLLAHFRLHLLIISVAVAGAAMATRLPAAALIAALAALAALPHLHVLRTLVLEPSQPRPGPLAEGVPLSLISFNVRATNERKHEVRDYLLKASPDVLVIQEMQSEWREILSSLAQIYPYRSPADWHNGGTVLVFSRHPLRRSEKVSAAGPGFDWVTTRVNVAGRTFLLLGVHLESPQSSTEARQRNAQLEALATQAAQADIPILMAGDFNSTPWSPFFRRMLQEAGLKDAAQGRGWLPTWPASAGIAGIPIDHVLTTPDIAIEALRVAQPHGSDHRPIEARLRLPAPAEPSNGRPANR